MNVFRSLVKPAQIPLVAADLDEAVLKRAEELTERLGRYSELPSYLAKGKLENEWAKSRWEAAHKAVSETMKTPLRWRIAGHAGGWIVGLSVFALFVGFIGILATGGDMGWRTLCYPLVPMALGWAILTAQDKAETRRKKEQTRLPHLLAHVLPLLEDKSAVESAYCDGVAALMQTPEWYGQEALRDTLQDFKSLLETGRREQSRRIDVEMAMRHQTLEDVEAEANQLAERAAAVHNSHARDIFACGLAHLEARRARLQRLQPLRERSAAREAATVQALKEAQAALASLPFSVGEPEEIAADSRAAAAEAAEAFAPAPWNETARRLCQQTGSVERAMQEVLGAGGGLMHT